MIHRLRMMCDSFALVKIDLSVLLLKGQIQTFDHLLMSHWLLLDLISNATPSLMLLLRIVLMMVLLVALSLLINIVMIVCTSVISCQVMTIDLLLLLSVSLCNLLLLQLSQKPLVRLYNF